MAIKITPGEWNDACDSYGRVQHSRKYNCVYAAQKNAAGSTTRIITIAARIENQEDALLIAAAPELLAACEAMLEAQSARRHPLGAPDEGIGILCAEAASKARAAIAKAQGGTQ